MLGDLSLVCRGKITMNPFHFLSWRWLSVSTLLLAAVLLPPAVQADVRLPAIGAVQLIFSQCGCLCVEGVPKTLYTTVEEAQAEPGLCGQHHCPEYVATEQGSDAGQRYVTPHTFADNCRDVRIWDSSAARYAGIKVCDVLELSAASASP